MTFLIIRVQPRMDIVKSKELMDISLFPVQFYRSIQMFQTMFYVSFLDLGLTILINVEH